MKDPIVSHGAILGMYKKFVLAQSKREFPVAFNPVLIPRMVFK